MDKGIDKGIGKDDIEKYIFEKFQIVDQLAEKSIRNHSETKRRE